MFSSFKIFILQMIVLNLHPAKNCAKTSLLVDAPSVYLHEQIWKHFDLKKKFFINIHKIQQ